MNEIIEKLAKLPVEEAWEIALALDTLPSFSLLGGLAVKAGEIEKMSELHRTIASASEWVAKASALLPYPLEKDDEFI